jgi:hypothetical protein
MAGPVQIKTKLPVRECAALFQQSMRVSRLSEFKGQGTQFMKPPVDEAFGDLDEDPPSFSVRAVMGGGGAEAQKSAVDLYAWDRDGYTEIELSVGRALFALGFKAKGKIMKFVQVLRQADPSAEYAGL